MFYVLRLDFLMVEEIVRILRSLLDFKNVYYIYFVVLQQPKFLHTLRVDIISAK